MEDSVPDVSNRKGAYRLRDRISIEGRRDILSVV